MNTFTGALIRRLHECSYNRWRDNYDESRFGLRSTSFAARVGDLFRRTHRRMGLYSKAVLNETTLGDWESLIPDLEWLYRTVVDEHSRRVLVDVIAYRLLGPEHVKLWTNNSDRRNRLASIEQLADRSDGIPLDFLGWSLNRFDLSSLGFPVSLYIRPNGVFVQFVLQQYLNNGLKVQVNPGDVVLDCGGCYGDTAINFALMTGATGKVYSFEFVPENQKIFDRNLALNPELKERISIIPHALWDKSDLPVFVTGTGPGSTVTIHATNSAEKPTTSTLTIDDFVNQNSIERVDFIKMDIEGAEFPALKGAVATIKRFQPKLALCVYHSPPDFTRLAEYIDDLGLSYRFAMDHFTIHAEETVLYASTTGN